MKYTKKIRSKLQEDLFLEDEDGGMPEVVSNNPTIKATLDKKDKEIGDTVDADTPLGPTGKKIIPMSSLMSASDNELAGAIIASEAGSEGTIIPALERAYKSAKSIIGHYDAIAAKKEIADASDEMDPDIKAALGDDFTDEDEAAFKDRAELDFKHRFKGPKRTFPSVLLFAPAGAGKTTIVENWCRKKGLEMNKYLLSSSDADKFEGLKYVKGDRAQTIPTADFDELFEKPSVVFLDELDKANFGLQGTLLTLIANHEIAWSNGSVYVPGIVFIVAAVNNVSDIIPAIRSRMTIYAFSAKPPEVAEYLSKTYRALAVDCAKLASYYKGKGEIEKAKEFFSEIAPNQRRAIAAKKLLTPLNVGGKAIQITFASTADELSNEQDNTGKKLTDPRGIDQVLMQTDGSPAAILGAWDKYCNPLDKAKATQLLENFPTIEDKTTQVFDTDPTDPKGGKKHKTGGGIQTVAQGTLSYADRIRKFANDHNYTIGDKGN